VQVGLLTSLLETGVDERQDGIGPGTPGHCMHEPAHYPLNHRYASGNDNKEYETNDEALLSAW